MSIGDRSNKRAGSPPSISRRVVLQGIGTGVAAAPLFQLLGCSSQPAGSNGGSMDVDALGQTESRWASGGTAAMKELGAYPNPFLRDPHATCALSCKMTIGPCYTTRTAEREDISEGQPGIPMRLGYRIVDKDCQPVPGADVDVWHCNADGSYAAVCAWGGSEAETAGWFRGYQTTDENGEAWFNSCFPGRYGGRAIHIHITVRYRGHEGDEYVTTQFFFADELIDEICGGHPDYATRGLPDTNNTMDVLLPADHLDVQLMEKERMDDGAMLAWNNSHPEQPPGGSMQGAITIRRRGRPSGGLSIALRERLLQ